MNRKKAYKLAEKHLRKKRLKHSENVASLACELARFWGVDEEKAYLAGILHDVAKEMPLEEQVELIIANEGAIPEIMFGLTATYHGPAGVSYLRSLGFCDEEVLDAIYYHSYGKANMSELGKIIFLADFLEVGREFERIEFLRGLLWENLDLAMYHSQLEAIAYLEEKGREIHINAFLSRDFYLDIVEKTT